MPAASVRPSATSPVTIAQAPAAVEATARPAPIGQVATGAPAATTAVPAASARPTTGKTAATSAGASANATSPPPQLTTAQAGLPAAIRARPAGLDAVSRAALAALAAGAACSRVTVEAATDGILIQGFMPDPVARDALLAEASALVAPWPIVSRLDIQPRPFCDYLRLAPGGAGPGSAALDLNQADGIFHQDDYLAVEVGTELEAPGYLYVDFISNDGRVFHLLPHGLEPDNRVTPGARDMVRLGVADAAEAARTPERRHYRLGRPYGQGMLLVHLTERPLFAQLREEVEPTSNYLPALEQALANHAGGFTRETRFLEIRP